MRFVSPSAKFYAHLWPPSGTNEEFQQLMGTHDDHENWISRPAVWWPNIDYTIPKTISTSGRNFDDEAIFSPCKPFIAKSLNSRGVKNKLHFSTIKIWSFFRSMISWKLSIRQSLWDACYLWCMCLLMENSDMSFEIENFPLFSNFGIFVALRGSVYF